MLPRLDNPLINTSSCQVQIGKNVHLYVKTLQGPKRSGRKAIYIHGGGGGGNHTLIERPSRHLIHEGFFDEILLPDRRGDGASSPLDHRQTVREHAQEMSALLNTMGVEGSLTAIGVSYGGPIALDLAALDERIERVVLMASSPALNQNNGIARLLLKSGLLSVLMKAVYRRYLGQLPAEYVDFDPAYDAKTSSELVRMFTESLKRSPKDHLQSFIYSIEATLEEANASLDEDVRVSIPVIQIVGHRDEVWGSRLMPEYLVRFPKFRQYQVPEGKIHKDVFLKPLAFQRTLMRALKEEFGQP